MDTVKRILKKKKNSSVSVRKTKKQNQDVKSIRYQDYLIKTLQDPKEAAGYLNAALSGGDIKVFLLALQNCGTSARWCRCTFRKNTQKSNQLVQILI